MFGHHGDVERAAAFIGVFAVILWLTRAMPGAAGIPGGKFLPLSLALGFCVWLALRWVDDRLFSLMPESLPGPRSRVRCFGSDRQLRRLAPIPRPLEEPEMFSMSWRRSGLIRPGRFDSLCLVLGCLSAMVFCELYKPGATFPNLPLMEFFGVTALGSLALRAGLRPVHLRLSPGLAEVIVSGPAGLGVPTIESIDLHESLINVQMYQRVVLIHTPGKPTRSIGGVGDPTWEPLVRALIQASLSPARRPPLTA